MIIRLAKKIFYKIYSDLSRPKEVASILNATEAQYKVDLMASHLLTLPQIECPITHFFTPGLYTRQCFVPKGSVIISKIHKTEHPFVISKGEISVWIEGTGVVKFTAPFTGITKPGTRRVLYAHEDTIWTTFHPTDETDLAVIEDKLIEPRDVNLKIEEAQKCLGFTSELLEQR